LKTSFPTGFYKDVTPDGALWGNIFHFIHELRHMALPLCHHGAFGTVLTLPDFSQNHHFTLYLQWVYDFFGFAALPLLGRRRPSVFNQKILWQKY